MNLGAAYDIGIQLRDAIQKYNLTLKTLNNYSVELVGENCVILFSADHTGVDMTFTNPKESDETVYDPWNYTDIVYGYYTIETEQELGNKGWEKDQNTLYKNYAAYYNKIILEYFAPVMDGDYSWKEEFVKWVTEIREIIGEVQFELEWDNIREKDRNKDITFPTVGMHC